MRVLGFILTVSLALALLRAIAQVVAVLLLGMTVWLGVTRPRETAGFLLMFTALGSVNQYPFAGLAIFGALAIVGLLVSKEQ